MPHLIAGLRLGESSGLQLDDIDFLKRTIHVRQQLQRRRGGRRTLASRSMGAHETSTCPTSYCGSSPSTLSWVSHRMGGCSSPQPTVPAHHRRRVVAAHPEGCGREWGAPARASALLRERSHCRGCDVVTVQRSLGHRSPSITLDTYSHLWPSAEDRTRAAPAAVALSVLTAAPMKVGVAPGAASASMS